MSLALHRKNYNPIHSSIQTTTSLALIRLHIIDNLSSLIQDTPFDVATSNLIRIKNLMAIEPERIVTAYVKQLANVVTVLFGKVYSQIE